ncbi:MAG TPA: PLP-dependent aspartate aminotransferase family protein [Phycisphaerae bacterium]|nr:PLP-dependent aspartate aminotransferase family protein [Phycisphaerae bacterium]HQL53451.1 PLP-dependent aspartate aminotransferase family protein [Phycisphaerae bacterium]
MRASDQERDPRAAGGFETLCAHFGEPRTDQRGAASPPIYQTSTFVYPDAESFDRRDQPDTPFYDYTRRSNPTTAVFEAKLARLEHGNWARAFASGMGAITAAINLRLTTDAHVVVVSDCYQPTRRYLAEYLSRFNVSVTFVPGTNPDDFAAALRDETQLIYLESPTTGRFDVIDLAPIVAAARQRGILTMLDNSWSTPYFQCPLDLGVDLVVHSATKFIGGHSDTLGGVVVGRDDALGRKLCCEAENLGASIDPFAAWLLVRGLRTLAVRMEQHQRSGLALARMLAAHPAVQRVYHPGLESYANYAVGRRQMRGYSGLFSFALRDQSQAAAHRFMNRLRIFSIGCSWGGYESLVVGGLSSTLFAANAGEPAWIIRLHAGLESTDDLLNDVRHALED